MEAIINVLSVFYAFLVIVVVYEIMYKKLPSKKEIKDRQALLDKESKECLEINGYSFTRDAKVEILRQRKRKKILTLMTAAIVLMVFIAVISFFVSLSLTNINFMCFSGIVIALSSVVLK